MNDNYRPGMNEREFLVSCVLQKRSEVFEKASRRYYNGLTVRILFLLLGFTIMASMVGAYWGLHQTAFMKAIEPESPILTLVFEVCVLAGLVILNIKDRKDYASFSLRRWLSR